MTSEAFPGMGENGAGAGKITQHRIRGFFFDGKELPDEVKTVASPLPLHPSPTQQSVFSSKRSFRKEEKILKFHIKNVWGSFGNTQNVRSKLQQQQRDFTDVFHIKEKKKKSHFSTSCRKQKALYSPKQQCHPQSRQD